MPQKNELYFFAVREGRIREFHTATDLLIVDVFLEEGHGWVKKMGIAYH